MERNTANSVHEVIGKREKMVAVHINARIAKASALGVSW